jgi:hypothetical protein
MTVQEHEARKRDPARLGEILVAAQQQAETGTQPVEDKPW